jgi:hypothetical protein
MLVRNSGASSPTSIHLILRQKICQSLSVLLGMLSLRIDQEQRKRTPRDVQRMSSVPLVSGPGVYPAVSMGIGAMTAKPCPG